jgi:GNAT superfamily N-acetyltransferase
MRIGWSVVATIRHAEPADYASVIGVIDDWWGGRPMAAMLPKLFFVHFRDTSFVAEEDGRVVGFLCGFRSQTHDDEAYIHFVGVDPSQRGSGLGRELYERFFAAVTITPEAVRRRILDREFYQLWDEPASEATMAERYFTTAQPGLSELDQLALGDLTVHMPASLLQRLDRSSMASSLEARVPFLSHQFVDWALTVPTEMKLRNGVGKHVLRRAIEPLLPRGAVGTRKLGFQMPLADWFVGGFNDFARDAWQSSGLASAGFLDPRGVDQMFDEHRRGVSNHGRLLYAIAMLSCWWREQRPMPASVSLPERQIA